jgi:hypothetical protein
MLIDRVKKVEQRIYDVPQDSSSSSGKREIEYARYEVDMKM